MKKLLLIFLFTVSLLGGYAQRTIKIDTKSADVEQWINRNFGKGQAPPFSFIYDGTPSERFIKKMELPKSTQHKSRNRHLFLYRHLHRT